MLSQCWFCGIKFDSGSDHVTQVCPACSSNPILPLLEVAVEDLDAAMVLLQNDRLPQAVSLGGQAAEKSLKAAGLTLNRTPPHTHSYTHLLRLLDVNAAVTEGFGREAFSFAEAVESWVGSSTTYPRYPSTPLRNLDYHPLTNFNEWIVDELMGAMVWLFNGAVYVFRMHGSYPSQDRGTRASCWRCNSRSWWLYACNRCFNWACEEDSILLGDSVRLRTCDSCISEVQEDLLDPRTDAIWPYLVLPYWLLEREKGPHA